MTWLVVTQLEVSLFLSSSTEDVITLPLLSPESVEVKERVEDRLYEITSVSNKEQGRLKVLDGIFTS